MIFKLIKSSYPSCTDQYEMKVYMSTFISALCCYGVRFKLNADPALINLFMVIRAWTAFVAEKQNKKPFHSFCSHHLWDETIVVTSLHNQREQSKQSLLDKKHQQGAASWRPTCCLALKSQGCGSWHVLQQCPKVWHQVLATSSKACAIGYSENLENTSGDYAKIHIT